ncbi:MAG: hypothetical protein U0599_13040 [Vicinamibacteria bacterium]
MTTTPDPASPVQVAERLEELRQVAKEKRGEERRETDRLMRVVFTPSSSSPG